jgi:hypothetical protein
LQLQIEGHGQNTIAVFALHKCGGFRPFADHLTVMTAHRLALDGDFGVANGASNAKSSKASSAIFMRSSCPETALWCVLGGRGEVQWDGKKLKGRHSGAMRSIELRCAIAHLRISRFPDAQLRI